MGINPMKVINFLRPCFLLFLLLFIANGRLIAQEKNTELSNIYNYSLKELAEIKVVTGSIQKQIGRESPTNIMVFTKQMIEERGYQTLVDLCQDVPGFDFLVFNGGSSEHSTYNMNRGLGNVGNPQILIMIDGIVQNNISFNWSLLWTYDNMFTDVDRVEIVQGPGSVLYGAQAVTGVINIITQKNFTGAQVRTAIGSNLTKINDLYVGANLKHSINLSLAIHSYATDGDGSANRYDPGGYFYNNLYPNRLTENYTSQGNYVQNVGSRFGGQAIPNGFNTENNSYAARLKLRRNNSELGFAFSEFDRGYGSTIAAYEYDLTAPESRSKYRSNHAYFKNHSHLTTHLELNSSVVFRGTHVLPETGLRYLYRFEDLTKSYTSKSYQGYLEEKLTLTLSDQSKVYFGARGMISKKSESIVSLGRHEVDDYTTSSSWDIADSGNGLQQSKTYPTYLVKEMASYLMMDKQWAKSFFSSIGMRYDYSTEFGGILNPRLALVYSPENPVIGGKLMYGRAFRQPGVFELTSEFRGNENLIPEKIETVEFELNSHLADSKIYFKSTAYFSILKDYIGKVEDVTKPAGERFENLSQLKSGGITARAAFQLTPNAIANANYNYLIGIESDELKFHDIDRTAKHKINAGINYKLLDQKLTCDLRVNWVGQRKAPETNVWIQTQENGYAPAYAKMNLTLGYRLIPELLIQTMIYNLSNTQYYGVGRETGSANIDDYDFSSQVDPDGFIPSYHPQPGRTFLIRLIYNRK